MLVGFHPFRHHAHGQAVRHLDDGPGDGRVVRVVRQVGDEGAVDFQCVHREPLQVVKR